LRQLRKILWYAVAVFAFVNALEALRYLLPHVPFPAQLDNFNQRRIALTLHALGGAIALLAGPLQFVPRFRESNWNRHRLLDLLRRGIPGVVRFLMDCAAFADWLDGVLGIFDARRGLDCNDGNCSSDDFARRSDAAPALDDSQLCPDGSSHHAADLPSACFPIPLAFFDRVPRDRVAMLGSERTRS
jgi:hypothetical protein